MVALFLFFFVLFSIHCLQVMYLLKKTESISKTTSQDQLRDSRAACCDWQQWKEKQMLKGEKEKFRVIHISILQRHSRGRCHLWGKLLTGNDSGVTLLKPNVKLF